MARTEIKPEFVGTSAINPFVSCVSSSRSVMDYSHVASKLSILQPDEKIVKSGIEYELAKYVNDVRTEHDVVVKGIIQRYPIPGVEIVPCYTVLAEYEQNDKIFLDYIDVDTFRSSNGFFGFRLTPTDTFNSLSYNQPVAKDTILAKTDSYGEDGAYNYGLNANVAFMSHPGVAEDGFVISESFSKRTQFHSIIKRVINITKDTIPVNLYGNNEIFKFLPNIGEKVRPDGLLCALRERNDWFSISDVNDASLSEVDVTFDNLIYVNPNATVIDIKVTRGNYTKPEFSSKITQQLDDYALLLTNYYSSVIKQYTSIMEEKKRMYGNIDNVRLTPRLHRFITDSMIKVNATTSTKNKLCYRKLPIDQYRIEITTRSTMQVGLGLKLTDISASKGVVCKILPDEYMPVDKNGVRADVITDDSSTVSRMNLGRTYESYLGATSRDNRQKLINYFYSKYGNDLKGKLTQEDVEYIRVYLRGLYELINPKMVTFIDAFNYEELENHCYEVLFKNLYIYYCTDNEINITDVINNIENSIYKPLYDTVTYKDAYGRDIETEKKVRIGQLYIMVLEKIANTYSAVSSSKVNNFGFPIKGTNFDKYKHPHSLTPTKTLGETEVRILTSFAPPEFIADLIDISLNPISHKYLIKNTLESESAFNTNFNIDRNVVSYGNTKSLGILQHMFNAAGCNMSYEEPEK